MHSQGRSIDTLRNSQGIQRLSVNPTKTVPSLGQTYSQHSFDLRFLQ